MYIASLQLKQVNSGIITRTTSNTVTRKNDSVQLGGNSLGSPSL